MSRSVKPKSTPKKVEESSVEIQKEEKPAKKVAQKKASTEETSVEEKPAQKKTNQKKKSSTEETSVEEISVADTSVEEKKSAEEKSQRAPRQKPTAFQVAKDLAEILELVEKEIETRQKNRDDKGKGTGTKQLRTIRKRLVKATKDANRLPSRRALKQQNEADGKPKTTKTSGFSVVCKITPELRAFMGLKEGVDPARLEITHALCCYVKYDDGETRESMKKWAHVNTVGRNLQDPNDKMKIIPDDKLSKLLRYPEYVKQVNDGKITTKVKNSETGKMETQKVTDASLKYCTLQRLIQVHVLETIKPPKQETA